MTLAKRIQQGGWFFFSSRGPTTVDEALSTYAFALQRDRAFYMRPASRADFERHWGVDPVDALTAEYTR